MKNPLILLNLALKNHLFKFPPFSNAWFLKKIFYNIQTTRIEMAPPKAGRVTKAKVKVDGVKKAITPKMKRWPNFMKEYSSKHKKNPTGKEEKGYYKIMQAEAAEIYKSMSEEEKAAYEDKNFEAKMETEEAPAKAEAASTAKKPKKK